PKENALRFSLALPGVDESLELAGELAWGGSGDVVGVRFMDTPDVLADTLRRWLNSQLPEPEQDDPPVVCGLSDLSPGGCYLTSNSPFPRGTRVVLAMKTPAANIRAVGLVLVAHPEFGMGVEFLRSTPEQAEQAQHMIAT